MFYCKHCLKSFGTLKYLIDHIRFTCKHACKSNQPFACGQGNCSLNFLSASSLKRHINDKHDLIINDNLTCSDLSVGVSIPSAGVSDAIIDASEELNILTENMTSSFEKSLLSMYCNLYKNPQVTRSAVQYITLEFQNF